PRRRIRGVGRSARAAARPVARRGPAPPGRRWARSLGRSYGSDGRFWPGPISLGPVAERRRSGQPLDEVIPRLGRVLLPGTSGSHRGLLAQSGVDVVVAYQYAHGLGQVGIISGVDQQRAAFGGN